MVVKPTTETEHLVGKYGSLRVFEILPPPYLVMYEYDKGANPVRWGEVQDEEEWHRIRLELRKTKGIWRILLVAQAVVDSDDGEAMVGTEAEDGEDDHEVQDSSR